MARIAKKSFAVEFESFFKYQTLERAQNILQKLRNNRQTDSSFCIDIEEQLEQIRKYLEEKQQEIVQEDGNIQSQESGGQIKEQIKSELAENYQTVTPQERQEGISALKQLRQKIQQIIHGK